MAKLYKKSRRLKKTSKYNIRMDMDPTSGQLIDELRDLKGEIFDLEPVWRKSKRIVTKSIQRAISTHGASIDSPWAPLSEDYANRVGRKQATLYITGKLHRAATRGTWKMIRRKGKAIGARYRVSHDAVRRFTFGSFPFVEIDKESRDRIRFLIGQHITERANEFYRKRGIAGKGLAR